MSKLTWTDFVVYRSGKAQRNVIKDEDKDGTSIVQISIRFSFMNQTYVDNITFQVGNELAEDKSYERKS